ncbi:MULTISPECIES: hypothetical protein [Gammaproteobacteria]|nr:MULTISPECIES: hypothetical protein [Gammaproteobacteria]MBO9483442.1 hypothetical protein [Salinisphaera sp. G21_0]MBO9496392.1 hypothetical protein [Thalassotalea sp. G20_0]
MLKLDKLQHIPLDMDVFPMDNSKTKKEKVEWQQFPMNPEALQPREIQKR